MTTELLLASASPRRRELISMLKLPFECVSVDIDESTDPNTPPHEAAVSVACRKARAAAQRPEAQGRIVVSADTMVVVDDTIYGKPVDAADAQAMLRILSGRTHEVMTGVCLIAPDGRSLSFCDITRVTFYPLSDSDILDYVATGEPMDKAGAYGIQGGGALLTKGIEGDFFNVMGLPVARLKRAIGLLEQEEQR